MMISHGFDATEIARCVPMLQMMIIAGNVNCLREKKMDKKPTILYVADDYKTVIVFWMEIVDDLIKLRVPILLADKRKLLIETEHYKLRCLPIFSNDSSWRNFDNVTHLANCIGIYRGLFIKKVLYRLRQDVKEITNRNEILKLLSEGKL